MLVTTGLIQYDNVQGRTFGLELMVNTHFGDARSAIVLSQAGADIRPVGII
jgi:hypothetical protein